MLNLYYHGKNTGKIMRSRGFFVYLCSRILMLNILKFALYIRGKGTIFS